MYLIYIFLYFRNSSDLEMKYEENPKMQIMRAEETIFAKILKGY